MTTELEPQELLIIPASNGIHLSLQTAPPPSTDCPIHGESCQFFRGARNTEISYANGEATDLQKPRSAPKLSSSSDMNLFRALLPNSGPHRRTHFRVSRTPSRLLMLLKVKTLENFYTFISFKSTLFPASFVSVSLYGLSLLKGRKICLLNDQTMLTVDTCAMSGMPPRLSSLGWLPRLWPFFAKSGLWWTLWQSTSGSESRDQLFCRLPSRKNDILWADSSPFLFTMVITMSSPAMKFLGGHQTGWGLPKETRV